MRLSLSRTGQRMAALWPPDPPWGRGLAEAAAARRGEGAAPSDWTRRCGSRRTCRRSSSRRGCTRWSRAAPRTTCSGRSVHGGRQNEVHAPSVKLKICIFHIFCNQATTRWTLHSRLNIAPHACHLPPSIGWGAHISSTAQTGSGWAHRHGTAPHIRVQLIQFYYCHLILELIYQISAKTWFNCNLLEPMKKVENSHTRGGPHWVISTLWKKNTNNKLCLKSILSHFRPY